MSSSPSSGARLVAVALVAGAAGPLRFETAFAVAGEPATLHFQAAYVAGGKPHILEVWRDHDRHLKRVTDGHVTTYVTHISGDAEFQMIVVDPAKRVATTIDRTNLYRLGNFTDWFDLAHGLRYPRGVYRLAVGSAPHGVPVAVGRCTWYDLATGSATTHICWSGTDRLPLLIVAPTGKTVWQVTMVDRASLTDAVFRVRDNGFVHVNANRDINPD